MTSAVCHHRYETHQHGVSVQVLLLPIHFVTDGAEVIQHFTNGSVVCGGGDDGLPFLFVAGILVVDQQTLPRTGYLISKTFNLGFVLDYKILVS